jgi:flagellar biogenesis protein FliO
MKKSSTISSIPANGRALELAAIEDDPSLRTLRPQTGLLSRLGGWMKTRRLARSSGRRLRVAETVSLGEKRFVAVVQVDGRHFLLAGGPTNIALLAQLDPKDDFEDVLRKTMTVPPKPKAKRKQSRSGIPPQRSNSSQLSSEINVIQKKTSINDAGPKPKQAGKRSAFPRVPANVPLASPLNGTEPLGDLLNKSMPAVDPLAKAALRPNGRHAPGQTEEFA